MSELKSIEVGEGRFRVAPRPRGGDWLESELKALRREGVSFVVSLLTPEENEELRLEEEEARCKEMGLSFYSYPIVDRSVPSRRQDFEGFSLEMLQLLEVGEYGFIHCRAGLGRAPLLGCTILAQGGTPVEKAWEMLKSLRGQTVPDTEEQRAWVRASKGFLASQDPLRDAMIALLGQQELGQ